MYRRILVALENSKADESLLPHITQLAKIHRSELLLVHVADGWVARHYDQLQLRDSQEMKDDRAYLERVAKERRTKGNVRAERVKEGRLPYGSRDARSTPGMTHRPSAPREAARRARPPTAAR